MQMYRTTSSALGGAELHLRPRLGYCDRLSCSDLFRVLGAVGDRDNLGEGPIDVLVGVVAGGCLHPALQPVLPDSCFELSRSDGADGLVAQIFLCGDQNDRGVTHTLPNLDAPRVESFKATAVVDGDAEHEAVAASEADCAVPAQVLVAAGVDNLYIDLPALHVFCAGEDVEHVGLSLL